MSIYDSDRRYRRQMAGRLTRSVVYLLILGGVGLVSYQLGVEDLEAQKRQHEQVLDEINGRLAEMSPTRRCRSDRPWKRRASPNNAMPPMCRAAPTASFTT